MSPSECLGVIPSSGSCRCTPREAAVMAQAGGSLQPDMGNRGCVPAPGSGSVQAIASIWGINQQTEAFFLSLCLSNLKKYTKGRGREEREERKYHRDIPACGAVRRCSRHGRITRLLENFSLGPGTPTSACEPRWKVGSGVVLCPFMLTATERESQVSSRLADQQNASINARRREDQPTRDTPATCSNADEPWGHYLAPPPRGP